MSFFRIFSALTVLASVTLSLPARADIPPENQCSAANVGEECDNALVEERLVPGLCTQTMCTRQTADGPMTYPCFRCIASSRGEGGQPSDRGGAGGASSGSSPGGAGSSAGVGSASGGSGSSSSGGTTSASGARNDTQSKATDDGCSVAVPGASGSGLVAASVALGLAAAMRRRRSF
ncbi:MAG: hypothetical protein K0R38_499 [Polyangiaceae bacterium]|nr:hypothetical protein [Polyangiaceae bacterium]